MPQHAAAVSSALEGTPFERPGALARHVPARTDREARTFGNYEILSLLGRGGMAEVYRAQVLSGLREGQHVAIKRLLPELMAEPTCLKMFASEAKLSQLLEHPHIVDVYEQGYRDGIHYMAMELIDGRDLAHIINRCRSTGIQLPVDFAVYLVSALLEALSYAHAALLPSGQPMDLVHCDVSPSNLFISRVGEIKLGDFGVARGRLLQLDIPNYVAGKAFYVSPEVLDGAISPEADLWAAAITLYELLTLDRPFQGGTAEEVYKRVKRRKYRPLRELRPEVSEGLEDVFERALSKNPKDRFQRAVDFIRALQPHFDDRVGTSMAIAAVVRGLFGREG